MNIPQSPLERIIIIGGGFAGLNFAKKLNTKHYQVVLIDKNNFHTFQPLLYQVATAGLEPDSIAYPLRKTFKKKKNFHFRMAEVNNIDPEKQEVSTSIGDLHYDHLIVATGATNNFFGNKEIEDNAVGMKSLTDALDIRSLLLQNFEKSLTTTDLNERNALMHFVIVGGGPTGVELAGALAELKTHVLPNDYPDLDIRCMKISLIESSAILAAMSDKASESAHKFLIQLGVDIYQGERVNSFDGDIVKTNKGTTLESKTLIWAAGVKAQNVKGMQLESYQANGRIETNELGLVKGYDNIYAIGDVAATIDKEHPRGYPMLGSVAMQQGSWLAKNFNNRKHKRKVKGFKYKDKGTMATVGRNKAVADLKNWKFAGFFAWIVWMFVHLMLLVGFRNKVITFFNWTWSYINFDRGVRLIVRPYKKKKE